MLTRIFVVILVLCMCFTISQSRKTPAGRTPLGVSRSTSTKKPQLLAGPTLQPNPRAEQLELAKEKLRRKISYQTKKQQEEADGPITAKKTKIPRPEKIRKDTSISEKSTIKAIATPIELQEESFELETVEQEVLRSKGVKKTIPRTPLLLSLLAKRRKLQTKNDKE